MLFQSFITLATVLVVVLSLLKLLQRPRKNGNSLPGPPGMPFIGHSLLVLTKRPWKKFLQWKKEYGPIFGISVAGMRVVVVSDSTAMLEMFSRHDVLGSLRLEYYEKLKVHRGGVGIALSEGKAWQEYRTFVLKSFNDFGTRGRQVTDGISWESQKLVSDLKKRDGAPVKLNSLLQKYTLNAVWHAISNETFTPDGVQMVLTAVKGAAVFNSTLDFMGLLFPSFFDKFTSLLEWRYEASRKLRNFLSTTVDQHLSTRVPGQPRDMIDKYQDVVDETTDPESPFYATKKSIIPLMMDISNGSVDTSSITLQWLIMYTLKYPDIQAKIHAEISKVIGRDREPVYSDLANMPFTEACILETLRTRPVVQYGIPRRVLQDFLIGDKLIPRDALVILNLIGMNHDPSVWEDPEQFRPERFLTHEGTVCPCMRKKICTFNLGKHECPGERYARETLFIVYTSLVQNFELGTNETVCLDIIMGFVVRPAKPVSVSFKPRL